MVASSSIAAIIETAIISMRSSSGTCSKKYMIGHATVMANMAAAAINSRMVKASRINKSM